MCGFHPWVGKIPWRRAQLPTPVFLPGESHGQKSLVGYNPWGHKSWTSLKQLSTPACIYFFNRLFLAVLDLLCYVGFSLVMASRSYFSLQYADSSLRRLLLLPSSGCRALRLQQLWLPGSKVQAQKLWHVGLFAPQLVRSSWTTDRNRVPCTSRWVIYH